MIRRPLVDLYRQPIEAGFATERDLLLQRLGDVALEICRKAKNDGIDLGQTPTSSGFYNDFHNILCR
jgi:hypothetical protein